MLRLLGQLASIRLVIETGVQLRSEGRLTNSDDSRLRGHLHTWQKCYRQIEEFFQALTRHDFHEIVSALSGQAPKPQKEQNDALLRSMYAAFAQYGPPPEMYSPRARRFAMAAICLQFEICAIIRHQHSLTKIADNVIRKRLDRLL